MSLPPFAWAGRPCRQLSDVSIQYFGYIGAIHNDGANVLFCDGHVESAKQRKWQEPTDTARRRWNNDNQPHPETW
ncbi:MAG: hypothetical protein DME19_01215 [Verrucomicrobia bacterium]|nr:MAG: hypothetical protein DME19_01215 [Verrucomicrobiota bacterium]